MGHYKQFLHIFLSTRIETMNLEKKNDRRATVMNLQKRIFKVTSDEKGNSFLLLP